MFMKVSLYKNKIIKRNDINLIISQIVCDVNSPTCIKGEFVQWVRKTDIIEKNGKKLKSVNT